MSRLTNKDNDNIYRISGFTTRDELIDKLAIYEDLEEEIGCPLEVVFKALKEGIYYKFVETDYKLNKMIVPMSRIIDDKYCWTCPKWTSTTLMNVKLKDYKKTWWLKEDKSE